MKFSVGDKMMIRKTGEEGVIRAILDEQMVEVEVEGTVFPIFTDEIDHPYLSWFTKGKTKAPAKKVFREQIPVEKHETVPEPEGKGLLLIFMPELEWREGEERVARVKVFAANHSGYSLQLDYRVSTKQSLLFSFKTILEPFANVYIHYLDWELMQEIPRFEWEAEALKQEAWEPERGELRIKAPRLHGHIAALLEGDTPTFSYTLFTAWKPKIVREAPPLSLPSNLFVPKTRKKVVSMQEIPRYELDLHIENLSEQAAAMANEEKLSLQLATLERYIQLAIVHRQERMVVIHGVGAGVLKEKVIACGRTYPEIERIESGFQAAYGFGASVLHFRY